MHRKFISRRHLAVCLALAFAAWLVFPVLAFAQDASGAVVAPSVADMILALVPAAARPYVQLGVMIVAAASAIAAATPTPAQGTWRYTLYRILVDLPALNVLRAKQGSTGTPRPAPTGGTAAALALMMLLGAAVSACSSTGTDVGQVVASIEADAPAAFKQGCAAVSVAHGSFQAVAPALVTAGKLSKEDVDKEAAILAGVELTCASPPADLAAAAPQLLAQAAGIYLMLSVP